MGSRMGRGPPLGSKGGLVEPRSGEERGRRGGRGGGRNRRSVDSGEIRNSRRIGSVSSQIKGRQISAARDQTAGLSGRESWLAAYRDGEAQVGGRRAAQERGGGLYRSDYRVSRAGERLQVECEVEGGGDLKSK